MRPRRPYYERVTHANPLHMSVLQAAQPGRFGMPLAARPTSATASAWKLAWPSEQPGSASWRGSGPCSRSLTPAMPSKTWQIFQVRQKQTENQVLKMQRMEQVACLWLGLSRINGVLRGAPVSFAPPLHRAPKRFPCFDPRQKLAL